MRARGRSTPRRASSAICSSAPRTTCRSCNLTTPANYFHALRRQMHRNFRKPLIVMTPKSLLRHKECVSTLADIGPGTSFHRILTRPTSSRPDDKMRRVVLCSRQGLLRSAGRAPQAQDRRRRHRAHRAALSVPVQPARRAAGALSQRRDGVVPGGAGEHGRLELRRPAHRAGAGRRSTSSAQAAGLCRPRRKRRRPATGSARTHLRSRPSWSTAR